MGVRIPPPVPNKNFGSRIANFGFVSTNSDVNHLTGGLALHFFKFEIRNSKSEILLARVAQLEEAADLRSVL